MRHRSLPSWQLFLLLHTPNQSKLMGSLDTIVEETNEANFIDAESDHRCEKNEVNKTLNKLNIENLEQISAVEKNTIIDQPKEKSRKQWETSPDQIKEISRSFSQINELNDEQTNHENLPSQQYINSVQTNETLLPPINVLKNCESSKEYDQCMCETKTEKVMDKRNSVGNDSQWIVTKPKRTKPKDNLRLEGQMQMETTFKSSYESTSNHTKENVLKSNGVVLSSKTNNDKLKKQSIQLNHSDKRLIKPLTKKSKHRPSTSLKPGGYGYFNTSNKDSYKNFVIIDEKYKLRKNSNSKISSFKLPNVDGEAKCEQYIIKKQTNANIGKEDIKKQIKQINNAMQNMTTEDNAIESQNGVHKNKNGEHNSNISEEQTQLNFKTDGYESIKNNHKQDNKKLPKELRDDLYAKNDESWTVGHLEKPKRVLTRHIDNIKELGILDAETKYLDTDKIKTNKISKSDAVKQINTTLNNGNTKVKIENKHYIVPQRRFKKHKNECSVKLFQGDMDFSTTSRTFFTKTSPKPQQERRKLTAGKSTRKNGKSGSRNLFRASTEAQLGEIPDSQKYTETSTYQNQFSDRHYCPVIDLGTDKSDFKYKSESSGHQFYLPVVKY